MLDAASYCSVLSTATRHAIALLKGLRVTSIRSDTQRFLTYRDAIAVPLFTDSAGVMRSGLIADGRTVRESLYWRGRKPRYRAPEPSGLFNTEVIDFESIYAGHSVNQFGHFLLESLSRLWFARRNADLPLIWLSGNGHNVWQREILELVGVRNKEIFLENTVMFKKIHLPLTGFSAERSYTNEFDNFVSQVTPSDLIKGRRCWLSRSLLSRGGRVINEDIIESEAQNLGWTIYHPQHHTVREQLNFLSSCEDIAGWSGSAFHVLVLLNAVRSRLHIFARGPHLGKYFYEIADQKSINQRGYVVDLELVSGSRPGNTVWRANSEEQIISVLRDIS